MNNGYTYSERIQAADAGRAVEDYLSARYTHANPQQWRCHILEERVLVDGLLVTPATKLCAKQQLTYHRPAWEEPAAPLDFSVLYRRDNVLVVHKPAGLPTLAGGGFLEHTLMHQIKQRFQRFSPLHRLGRWTSGAVLCASTPAARRFLSAQFTNRTIYKRYRAIAVGDPAWSSRSIRVPIGPVPYPPLGTLHAASTTGRPAHSDVTVRERRGSHFLCDVVIHTGRPHQIRVHLASAGHPLVGDPLYGVGGVPVHGSTALPGDPGYSLHAAELRFVPPSSESTYSVIAPCPVTMKLVEEDTHR